MPIMCGGACPIILNPQPSVASGGTPLVTALFWGLISE